MRELVWFRIVFNLMILFAIHKCSLCWLFEIKRIA